MRETGVPEPSIKFACTLQNHHYLAIVEATIQLREKTGRSVSRSLVLDALVATADMAALVEEIAKRGES